MWVFGVLLWVLAPDAGQAAWPPNEAMGPVDYADPKNWPSDPGWGGQWQSWSFAPKDMKTLDARTKRLGMGGHYDRAWAKTPGDPRVLIAVLDSGSYWEDRDLVNKWFLSERELPPPADACQKPENRGEGKRKYDANADGVFNVQDYTTATGHEQPAIGTLCDGRVMDKNRNGIVDPQDLIAAFSDGKDDDKNGYIDDIAGWDFFRNDNDAMDETRYGHGTGEAHDSAGETDNGVGEAGVCPKCRVMPLRVGDSFVADANDFALAAAYSVDIGASVIQEALGTIDNTPLSQWAIDYAYDNHVAVIASAADENSYHQNFPGTNNHTIYVHAIRYNADDREDATHAFAFDNCTNYGAQLQLSVPGTHCSSEATGRGAGMAGLLYSAALLAGIPAPDKLYPVPAGTAQGPAGDNGPAAERVRRLTAEEVRQLMIGTADGFYDPSEDNNQLAYPTGPGFVRRFGYGRVNARSAVDRILASALPPQVEIERPEWFQVVGQDQTPLRIVGRIALRAGSADRYDYEVDWAPGVDPKNERFVRLARAELQSMPLYGTLAELPTKDLLINNPVFGRDDPAWQPDDIAHVHTITLRVRATLRSMDPLRNGLVGEARRAVHIHRDAQLLPGFPLRLGASGEASIKTADLNGDGKREIIVADSGGLLHAIQSDGKELPGWPVASPTLPGLSATVAGHRSAPAWSSLVPPNRQRPTDGSAILATPAIGDVNGDGRPDVVAATYDGHVIAFAADGKPLSGFPVEVDHISARLAVDKRHLLDDGFFASPVLADLDRDGKLDIIVASLDSQVYVWKGTGMRMPGWPLTVWDTARPDDGMVGQPRQQQRILSTPAVGDLNGDKIPDLVLGTNEQYGEAGRVYALDGRGSLAPSAVLPGWPVAVMSRDVLPVVGSGIPNAVAMADIDRDGQPEIFVNGIGSQLTVFRGNGQPFGVALQNNKNGFGSSTPSNEFATLGFIASPALGDLNGDGTPDAILPTAGANAGLSMLKSWERLDFEMHLSAWDVRSGKQLEGFPQVLEDYVFFMNAVIADVDGDGKREALAGSAGYFVHAWNAQGKEPAGFPKFTGGWTAATPAVGDLDGDGRLELVASTRNGWLFAWHTQGRAKGRIDWDSFHHDNQNTGNLATALDQGGDEVDPPKDERDPQLAGGGFGCQQSASGTPGLCGLLLGLGFLARAWRRRRSLRA